MWKYLLAFTATASLLGVLIFYADRAGVFVIRDVDVHIHASQGSESVFDEKKSKLRDELERFKGSKLWQVRIGEVSHKIMGHEWVAEARVYRHLPSGLEVHLTPKAIALVWVNEQGVIYPVASDGSMLMAAPKLQSPDVPILRGPLFARRSDLRQKAIALVNELPKQGSFTASAVSEIHFREADGFELLLFRNHGRIRMGTEQFAKRAARVSQVLSYLDGHTIEPRMIDANYARKVLVRVKNPQPSPSSKSL